MSNSVRSITILFDKDVTEEYIDFLERTALCYKYVQKVERDVSGNYTEWAIENRINDEWKQKLKDLIYSLKND